MLLEHYGNWAVTVGIPGTAWRPQHVIIVAHAAIAGGRQETRSTRLLFCRELDLRLSETSALATERDGRHLQIEG